MYGYLAIWIGLFSCLISCAHQEIELPPITVEEQQEDLVTLAYHIGVEDVVEVMVWKNEDLSRVVNVRPDGKISLPLIGDMRAAGLTSEQLKANISEELTRFYKESPQVSVIIQQVNSYAIYILGRVRSPGRYLVKTGITFLQALTLAGGFEDFASPNRIIVRRQKDDGTGETAMQFRYKKVVAGKENNILLKPGDTIIIP
jgi:polysaccharide export outer membrane protein